MTTPINHKSDIPSHAVETILERSPEGNPLQAAYTVGEEEVGARYWSEDGTLAREFPMKDGRKHGRCIDFYFDGPIELIEPHVDGLPHGTAVQYAPSGQVMGTYEMVHGTGLDLWRGFLDGDESSPVILCEATFWKDGAPEGFSWFLNDDQKSVWAESFHCKTEKHGYVWLERSWDAEKNTLAEGYPRFHADGRQISLEEYQHLCQEDVRLVPYKPEDDLPERQFPPEIAKHLYSGPDSDADPS